MGARKKRTAPRPGSSFTREYKGKEYTLFVSQEQGRIVYRMKDEMFESPTEAAESLTKYPINGWYFWHMDDSVSQGAAHRSRKGKKKRLM